MRFSVCVCVVTIITKGRIIIINLYYEENKFNSSITDIEYSPNYIAFGLPLTHQVR